MVRYERFDGDAPAPKFTIVSRTNDEKLDLFIGSTVPIHDDDETMRHALITLNIISIVVSTVCGTITFALGIEDRSTSALSFAVDTILDVLAFLTIIWRFTSAREQAQRETFVLRILAVLFLSMGFAVFIDSVLNFRNRVHPITNQYLVIAAAVQTLIFLCLAVGKYLVARKLQAISAYSDAFNTFISASMAFSVATTITLYNSNARFWYLDTVIGMCIAMTIMIYGGWLLFKSLR